MNLFWLLSASSFSLVVCYQSSYYISIDPLKHHKHKPYNYKRINSPPESSCYQHLAHGDSYLSTSDTDAYCMAFGGDLKRIRMEDEDDGLLASVSVPTFAAFASSSISNLITPAEYLNDRTLKDAMGQQSSCIESIPGAFQIDNVVAIDQCEEIIRVCEEQLHFHTYSSLHTSMKNNHGALQVVVSMDVAKVLANKIQPMVMTQWSRYVTNLVASKDPFHSVECLSRLKMLGVNRRWRIYRYKPGEQERFLPHIDAAFPPSGLSNDGQTMIWDVSTTEDEYKHYSQVVSRLTLLLYLNDDFYGGCTNFFVPLQQEHQLELLASIQPKAGSVLLFPQAVGEEEVEYARQHWPLHEGSPVTSGRRAKYVIRSDVLFAVTDDIKK